MCLLELFVSKWMYILGNGVMWMYVDCNTKNAFKIIPSSFILLIFQCMVISEINNF